MAKHWREAAKNPEILRAVGIGDATGLGGASDWVFDEEATHDERLDGAKEWYFWSESLKCHAKVWYERGRRVQALLMR